MMGTNSPPSITALVVLFMVAILSNSSVLGEAEHSYNDALAKSILFFEGQRSGNLPSDQRMKWRKDSALRDGHELGVDLVGGYYDAGDNLKFGFPMAFTITVLSWSVLEFGKTMNDQLPHAEEAIRWGTDYLMKATDVSDVVFAGVGDPFADHNCWERPEDMDTPRTVYYVNKTHPGSEIAAETAAALAASAIVFRLSDHIYSENLLQRAVQVFSFADKYRGSYNDSLGPAVCPFYCDFSGYQDELAWGAAWLHKATNNSFYWDYAVNYIESVIMKLGVEEDVNVGEFGWDDKHAGVSVLLASDLLMKKMNDSTSKSIIRRADEFVCAVLPDSPTRVVQYSPGGLLFKTGGSNMQNPTALSFLLLVYAGHLQQASESVRCGNITANSPRLVSLAKSQVDYILGHNPLNMSYMVGYGEKFPKRIHHRGSSLPSEDAHPAPITCKGGTTYYETKDPNPNYLMGAVVGGPNIMDSFDDDRASFQYSEPTTYINAPLVGAIAYFSDRPT